MDNTSAIVGIDIGGTKVAAALFQSNGDMLHHEVKLVGNRRGGQVIDLIADLTQNMINYGRSSSHEVGALGLCVPGIYNPIDKTAWAPNIPEWDHIPIWEELTTRVKEPSLKIVLESDRSCYIMGEMWKGGASNCTDAIFMAVGTGIGVGILANGRIISGRSGIAGAIGWMALEPPFDQKYNACGNFEHYASGDGIARSAIELLQQKSLPNSSLHVLPRTEISAQKIFQAFENGDPIATAVLEKAIRYWGMAVANLVSIFNPQKIIFGGGVFGPAEKFLNSIEKEARKWAQPISIEEVSIEVSVLGGDAGLIGAGYLAIQAMQE